MENRLFGVAERPANQPCIVLPEFAVPALHIDGIDGLAAHGVFEHLPDSFRRPVNDGVLYLLQPALVVPFFLHLHVFQAREREPAGVRVAPTPGVRRGMVETIVPEQRLFVEPVVGGEQRGLPIALRLDFAHEHGRLFQVPLAVVQAVDEAAVGQDGHEGPPVALIGRNLL